MHKAQYRFALSVGMALLTLGGLIVIKANIGISLMVLGFAIMAVATWSRKTAGEDHYEPALLPLPARDSHKQSQ